MGLEVKAVNEVRRYDAQRERVNLKAGDLVLFESPDETMIPAVIQDIDYYNDEATVITRDHDEVFCNISELQLAGDHDE